MCILTTPRSEFLPTPIRMTLNDPEFPIQLEVRFPVSMLWLSGLTMRDWLNMGLNCQRKMWQMSISGLFEFSWGLLQRGDEPDWSR